MKPFKFEFELKSKEKFWQNYDIIDIFGIRFDFSLDQMLIILLNFISYG